ncbi:rifin PIR protein, putative [Plasmodium reichenowi]|uniref:Rifin PIR protein, putative n=1 Tax=Plasmodium reichenowi TaxID=5854 RepID=A0A2P9DBD6_PLARE|nr:rifin PIR protein, putative [Plasmodium reichenowi]
MKLHCSNILLFFLPLNIFLTSYHVNTHKKPSITPHHTPTTTSRMLSEYDIQSSIYDKDAEMKSVKEIFDRQTSQRLEEYEERMQEKRQKRKEERDKNSQKIISKDKMDKSLEEKVEKGCLRCGCALGGVAASVGLFGGLGIYGWKTAALATAKEAAEKAGMVEGAAKGASAGLSKFIQLIESTFSIKELNGKSLETLFTANTYTDVSNISHLIYSQYNTTCISHVTGAVRVTDYSLCPILNKLNVVPEYASGNTSSMNVIIQSNVKKISADAQIFAEATKTQVASTTTATLTNQKIGVIDAISSSSQTAIIASVVVLLIIVLVMIIIYLVLRYRRKKKMKKKAQYTKLLNQ